MLDVLGLDTRRAEAKDERALAAASGQAGYCNDRLVLQAADRGVLLAVWHGRRPVAWTFLWTAPAEEEDLRRYLPGVPLITHVEVFEEEHRNLGIGTGLLERAERLLEAKGYEQVALAVEQSNKDAARLYERLGYRQWDLGEMLICTQLEWLPGGGVKETKEKCFVYVKDLTGASPDQFVGSRMEPAVLQV